MSPPYFPPASGGGGVGTAAMVSGATTAIAVDVAANATVTLTGSGIGANTKALFPTPATAAASKNRVIQNLSDGDVEVKQASGPSVTVGAGLAQLLVFAPSGVTNAVTGV